MTRRHVSTTTPVVPKDSLEEGERHRVSTVASRTQDDATRSRARSYSPSQHLLSLAATSLLRNRQRPLDSPHHHSVTHPLLLRDRRRPNGRGVSCDAILLAITASPAPRCLSILINQLGRIFSEIVRVAMQWTVQDRGELVTETGPPPQMNLLTPDDEAYEVNSFFGWAISSLRSKLSNQRLLLKHGDSDDDVDLDATSEMIELDGGIRLFHDKAILDDEYMNKCYSTKHKLANRGWLSLVAKHMFPFGLKLMSAIRQIFNARSIQDRKSECVTAAYEPLVVLNSRPTFVSQPVKIM